MKLCSYCHFTNEDNNVFCRNCGSKFAAILKVEKKFCPQKFINIPFRGLKKLPVIYKNSGTFYL